MANTLSLLVRNQLPEFIRNDHDTFVAFIEAYYAWMDESNNVMQMAKSLPTHLDVDTTLDAFVTYFVKQFLPLFPEDRLTRPEFLIQHAKEFYRTKGTEKAYRLLFRILFDQDIDIFLPKNHILKCSDGQWVRPTSLRLDPVVWTTQVADGVRTRFRTLTSSIESPTMTVYVDDVLQTTSYQHSPNEPWVIFTNPPSANSIIKLRYDETPGIVITKLFNTNQLTMRLVGTQSGASCITEKAQVLTENGLVQLNIGASSPLGTFQQSEEVRGKYVYDLDTGDYIYFYGHLLSHLTMIQVIDGGLNYNVGDPVIVSGGDPSVVGSAVVDSVYSAVITSISVLSGGAGYQAGQPAYITSTPNTGLNVFVSMVDTSGTIHPNTYPINTDVLSLWANTAMSNSEYYFSPAASENVNSIMSLAFTDYILGSDPSDKLGPITDMAIISSTAVWTINPTLKIDAPTVTVTGNTANGNTANATVSLGYFGILGRMNVHSGGIGYTVGDEVSFENIPGIGIGLGAAAEVMSVHPSNSGIKLVQFQPTRITGNVTVNTSISSVNVTGNGTLFTTDLRVGDYIELNSESSYVQTITNNTHLVVNTAFTRTSTSRKLGVYNRYFVGGINYRQDALPIVHVSSSNVSAYGANITADAVISGGETLLPISNDVPPGKIIAIRVTNPGYGYQSLPTIDLTGSGNHQATALAILLSNLFTASGHYESTRGFLSSDQRIQGGDSYYAPYSYVIRSQVELDKYKNILKDLIHPAGTRLWGEYIIESNVRPSPNTTANIANTFQTSA
jgi:hypothetical protein